MLTLRCIPCLQVARARHTSSVAGSRPGPKSTTKGATTAFGRSGSKGAAAAPAAAAGTGARDYATNNSRQQQGASTAAAVARVAKKRAAPGPPASQVMTASQDVRPTASKGGRLAAMGTSSRLTHGMHRYECRCSPPQLQQPCQLDCTVCLAQGPVGCTAQSWWRAMHHASCGMKSTAARRLPWCCTYGLAVHVC